jgi:hypothetical protein
MREISGDNFVFAFELTSPCDLYDIYSWFEPGTISQAINAATEEDAETIACTGYLGVDLGGVGVNWRFKRRRR